VDSNVIRIFKELVKTPWIEVVFLMDPTGALQVSVGSSPAFSHSGEFRGVAPAPDEEPASCLYLTALNPALYLGIIFQSQASIDDVRTELNKVHTELVSLVSR
jgi:hypothetical protein